MNKITLNLTDAELRQLLSSLSNDYSDNDAEGCRAIVRIQKKIEAQVSREKVAL